MREIWNFIKYSFYIFGGSAILGVVFIYLAWTDKISWGMLFLPVILASGGFLYLVVRSVKKVMKNFDKEPIAQYYDDNLRDAKRKLKTIRSYISKLPQGKAAKFHKTYDYMKQIYVIVEKKPSKYSQARTFFNEDIDNTLKIVENYLFITQQPTKSAEMNAALSKTEAMISNIEKKYEGTIHELVTQDVASLDMELDYLKNKMDDPTSKFK